MVDCLVCGAEYDDRDTAETAFHVDELCKKVASKKEEPVKTGYHCRGCGAPVPGPGTPTLGREWCCVCQDYMRADKDEKEEKVERTEGTGYVTY